MRIQVHPIKLGIVVMRNLNDINPELTSKLRERHYHEVLEALSAFTFRPILHLRFLSKELYAQAQQEGFDPEAQPVVVKDESRRSALEALAAVGGATVADTPEGSTGHP